MMITKWRRETKVVSTLKEAIAKIKNDDKGIHEQQSTLFAMSQAILEAVERDLK